MSKSGRESLYDINRKYAETVRKADIEVIEKTLLKCQRHICPHDLTRQECDITNCEEQILCNRITHLLKRNREY